MRRRDDGYASLGGGSSPRMRAAADGYLTTPPPMAAATTRTPGSHTSPRPAAPSKRIPRPAPRVRGCTRARATLRYACGRTRNVTWRIPRAYVTLVPGLCPGTEPGST